MSETITVPRYAGLPAQMKLERAEAVVARSPRSMTPSPVVHPAYPGGARERRADDPARMASGLGLSPTERKRS